MTHRAEILVQCQGALKWGYRVHAAQNALCFLGLDVAQFLDVAAGRDLTGVWNFQRVLQNAPGKSGFTCLWLIKSPFQWEATSR